MARPPFRPGTDRPVSVDALDDFADRVAGFLDMPRHLNHGLLIVHVPRRAPTRPVVVRVLPHGASTNE
jgi:hypothetical protein